MAVDEVLLDAVAAGAAPPTLRLYGWSPPAVSLGRFQDDSTGINRTLCARNGWEIVRRPTGGRAVLHDQEITFSIVLPLTLVADVGVLPSYCLFSRAVNAALAGVGVDPSPSPLPETERGFALFDRDSPPRVVLDPLSASGRGQGEGSSCFAAALAPDSLIAGRKLVGAAQVRRGGALLQQGSILIEVDRDTLRALFGEVGPITTLAELVADLPSWEELGARLANGIAGALGVTLDPGELTPEECATVAARLDVRRQVDTRSPGRRAALDSA
jgi:lipoate-protein ligase A